MTNNNRRICLWVLALIVLIAAGHTARASSVPAGFADVPVNRPDGRPWDSAAGVTFSDGGRMFVWERTGRVWLYTDAPAGSKPLIDLSDEVSTIGSLGLTGFALDPHFAWNGYVYLFYAVEPEHLANCDAPRSGAAVCRAPYRAGQHASSGATIGRLVRYQVVRPAGEQDFRSADTVNYASRRVLLGETPGGGTATGCVVTDTAHGPGGLAFGSDGTLLAGCGDGASVSDEDSGSDPTTQYQEALVAGLMMPAENVGAFRAQLVDSLSGKILRVNAASGDGVPNNPFYDPAVPRAPRSRVWILGLHDAQHLTVRPGSGSARVAAGRPGTLYIGEVGSSTWESLAVARDGRMNFGWPLYEGVDNDTTDYAALPALNLLAPNPLFPRACQQHYFRFRDLISADPTDASWPNPCQPSIEVPAAADVFIRDRPAIDWLHSGTDARWAAFDDSGEPLAVTLGTRAPNGELVSGPLFGGTASIGGVWYRGSSFPAAFRNVYYHADSGGEWIKAFTFDANDNPVAVQDFLAAGGPIQALGDDPRTGDLYYISGLSGSEVHKLTYSPTTVATAAPAAPTAGARFANLPSAAARVQTTPSTQKVASPANKVTAAHPAQSTSGWSGGDIGAVAAAGSYSTSGGVFTVLGSGVDIYNTADSFQFVS
ncbi:MAG: PQQ-dependent sugar dehydrogenase, partial [Steroidobacteraceae bacterium]